MSTSVRKTSIIATVGPACSDPDQLTALVEAGVNLFRLNFSHGEHEHYRQIIADIRSISAERMHPVGILQDLQGPKVRIGRFADGPVTLKAGQQFIIRAERGLKGDEQRVSTGFDRLHEDVEAGQHILLDDGKLTVRIIEIDGLDVITEVITGGVLSDHKGMNIPEAKLSAPSVTDKDAEDLKFGSELGVDWVALSFVRNRDDVLLARHYMSRFGSRARLMAKIEKPASFDEYQAIIVAADAIMIARGDLGVELSPERVPMLQKRLIHASREAGKPVVTATQMLESMTGNPKPTRAEASDVANAIYDGTDAVMLSAETAVGKYPVQAVQMMHRIAMEVEEDPAYRTEMRRDTVQSEHTTADSVARSACHMAEDLSAKVIVCFSHSGSTVLRVSRQRIATPILAITPNQRAFRQLSVSWGVRAVLADSIHSTDEMVDAANHWIKKTGIAESGDRYVITAGVPFGVSGTTNLIRAERVK